MPAAVINWLAVVVAALSAMVIGAIWYAPPIFGKKWMGLIHKNQKDLGKNARNAYIGTAVLSLVSAYVLAHIISYTGAVSAFEGAQAGFLVWVGFSAATSLTNSLIEHRSKKLWLINTAYQLIALIVMGIIIAAWGI